MPYIVKPKKKKPKYRGVNSKIRHKVYSNRRWEEVRQAKLMKNPLCELCQKKGEILGHLIVTPAEHCHHIKSFLNPDGTVNLDLAYNIDNICALCPKCHSFLHRNGRTNGIDLEYEAKELIKQEFKFNKDEMYF